MTERLHFDFSLSCVGEGNGNPLQCSCLENPRDGGAWWAAVYEVAQSRTRLRQLSSSSSNSHTKNCIYLKWTVWHVLTHWETLNNIKCCCCFLFVFSPRKSISLLKITNCNCFSFLFLPNPSTFVPWQLLTSFLTLICVSYKWCSTEYNPGFFHSKIILTFTYVFILLIVHHFTA